MDDSREDMVKASPTGMLAIPYSEQSLRRMLGLSASLFTGASMMCFTVVVMLFISPSLGITDSLVKFAYEFELKASEISDADFPYWAVKIFSLATIFMPAIILAALGSTAAFISLRLFRASGASYTDVISRNDYELVAPLVRDAKVESINEYIRLSSLRGGVGTFTKLGLTGLPLATISLTILFSFMSIYDSATFLDLTKLTLGAFIGSYVQRNVEIRRSDAQNTPPPQSPNLGNSKETGSS